MNDTNNIPSGGQQPHAPRRSLTRYLIAAALLIFVFQMTSCTTPQGLYHRAWKETQDRIYDPASLKDWAQWEHKYDGQLKTNDDATKAIDTMLASVHDNYTYFLSKEETQEEHAQTDGFVGIGVTLPAATSPDGKTLKDPLGKPLPKTDAQGHVQIATVVAGGPADKAGMKDGDTLLSIDGKTTTGMSLDSVVRAIRGPSGTSLTLMVRHSDGTTQTLTIKREQIVPKDVTTRHLPDGIGYIRLEDFEHESGTEDFENGLKQLDDCKAIIVDLRDNPGGLINNAIGISSLFIKQGTIVTVKERVPGGGYETTVYTLTANALLEQTSAEGSKDVSTDQEDREPYMLKDRPVVLLVNGNSASAAEMTTGALKDNNAVIVMGTKTFGKGIGQTWMALPGGTELHVTSLHYFTPSGAWIGDGGNSVQYGIAPNVEVKPADGLKFGESTDNQLQSAEQLLEQKLAGN